MVAYPRRTLAALGIAAAMSGPTWSVHAQAPADPSADAPPSCALGRRDHPAYIIWVCDDEGKAYAPMASIFHARTVNGRTRVVSRIWIGALADLLRQADAVLEAHDRAHAACTHYFHLARAEGRAADWNTASPAMREWWIHEGSVRFPALCYSPEPAGADFVIAWSAAAALPDAFSIEIPLRVTPARAAGPLPAAAVSTKDVSALAVYRVREGFDGAVVRLGPSIFASPAAEGESPSGAGRLAAALRFLAVLPPESR
jgi:hypothetical protein